MATTTTKETNSSGGNSQNYKTFLGARVLWPPDVDDDILEGAILETHNIIRDKTKDGQAVIIIISSILFGEWGLLYYVIK